MLLAGREPDDVARAHLLDWAAFALHPTQPRGNDHRLAERMRVPVGTRAGLEGDMPAGDQSSGLGRLEERIAPRTVPVNRPFGPLREASTPLRLISMANAARSAADAHRPRARPRAVPPAMSFRLDMLVIILSSCGRRGADEMSAIVETIEQELRVDGRRRSLSSFAILGAVV